MDRRATILLGGLLVVVFVGVIGTSLNSASEEVRPIDVVEGNYDGEYVTLKGRLADVSVDDSGATFEVTGPNASISVTYDGTVPATFEDGRHVIVQGTVRDGTLRASTIKVRAHLEGDRPTATS